MGTFGQSHMKQERTMAGKSLLAILLMLSVEGQETVVAAQDVTPGNPPLASEAVQELHEEALDEISLDRTVYFNAPDGTDAIAPAGLYRVESVGPERLRFIPPKSGDAMLVQALTMDHQDR